MEIVVSVLLFDDISNDFFGFYVIIVIVEIGEFVCDLCVYW